MHSFDLPGYRPREWIGGFDQGAWGRLELAWDWVGPPSPLRDAIHGGVALRRQSLQGLAVFFSHLAQPLLEVGLRASVGYKPIDRCADQF